MRHLGRSPPIPLLSRIQRTRHTTRSTLGRGFCRRQLRMATTVPSQVGQRLSEEYISFCLSSFIQKYVRLHSIDLSSRGSPLTERAIPGAPAFNGTGATFTYWLRVNKQWSGHGSAHTCKLKSQPVFEKQVLKCAVAQTSSKSTLRRGDIAGPPTMSPGHMPRYA